VNEGTKYHKIIHTEQEDANSLIQVTFQTDGGVNYFAYMSPEDLKVREFKIRMSKKLTKKEMEELEDCMEFAYREGVGSVGEE